MPWHAMLCYVISKLKIQKINKSIVIKPFISSHFDFLLLEDFIYVVIKVVISKVVVSKVVVSKVVISKVFKSIVIVSFISSHFDFLLCEDFIIVK